MALNRCYRWDETSVLVFLRERLQSRDKVQWSKNVLATAQAHSGQWNKGWLSTEQTAGAPGWAACLGLGLKCDCSLDVISREGRSEGPSCMTSDMLGRKGYPGGEVLASQFCFPLLGTQGFPPGDLLYVAHCPCSLLMTCLQQFLPWVLV